MVRKVISFVHHAMLVEERELLAWPHHRTVSVRRVMHEAHLSRKIAV